MSSTQVNCGLEEIVDFVHFPCVAAAIWEGVGGGFADNAINGSLLDTETLRMVLVHIDVTF